LERAVNSEGQAVRRHQKAKAIEMQRLLSSPAILGIALIVRFLWAAVVPVIPVSDPHDYHIFALNLVQHGVYGWSPDQPSAAWPPGTSAAYALIYSIFGFGQWAIKWFNLAIGVLIVLLTVELGSRWFNRAVGIVAGLLVALWPVFIEYTTIVASEMLFTAALLGVLLVFDEICSHEGHFSLLAAVLGGLIGCASLIRPTAILLPALVTSVYYVHKRKVIPSLKLISITTVLTLIVLLPWSARNYALFGEVVLTSTSGGANLWMGNNPATTGGYQKPPDLEGMNEVQLDRFFRNEAVTYITQAPTAFVTRTVVKALRLYERETIGVWWNARGIERTFGNLGGIAIKVASQAFWMGALLLFLIGCYFSSRQGFASFACHPAIATLAYFTIVYATFVIQDRYHIPTNPIMAIFAAYGIFQIVPVVSCRFWSFRPLLLRQAGTASSRRGACASSKESTQSSDQPAMPARPFS
jgi:4-amino-4-deoxy-L-arabinose transferase-like glycosyltransferase